MPTDQTSPPLIVTCAQRVITVDGVGHTVRSRTACGKHTPRAKDLRGETRRTMTTSVFSAITCDRCARFYRDRPQAWNMLLAASAAGRSVEEEPKTSQGSLF